MSVTVTQAEGITSALYLLTSYLFLHSHDSLILDKSTSDKCILYNKPTRCNSGSIMFIKNYKYALHVSDALCVHLQEHYNL